MRGLCPCLFLGGPGLELLEQGLGDRLANFGLALLGGLSLLDRLALFGWLALRGRFGRRCNLLARRRVRWHRRRQILRA